MAKRYSYKPTWFPNGIKTGFLELGTTIGKLDRTGVRDVSAQLQDALNNASSTGNNLVVLPAGTFSLATYLSIPSNVTLQGAGMGITKLVVRASGSFTPDPDSAGAIVFSGVNRSSIQDLTLDIGSTAKPDGIVFKPVAFQTAANTLTYGAATSASTHFSAGERITGGTSGATATVSLATPSSATAGTLRVYDIVGTFVSGETLTGNKVGSANTTSAVANPGTSECFALRCEVLGNAMDGAQYLIWLQNTVGVDVRDCIVDGRSITETAAHEWYAVGFGNSALDQEGIELRGARRSKITGNTCRNLCGPGIGIPEVDASFENDGQDIIVNDNVVERCGYGIYLNSCYSTANGLKSLSDIMVYGNTITNPWLYGIYVYHGSVNTVPQTLPYVSQSVNFAAGLVVTGTWSKAFGTIVSDSDAGATGTLTLTNINGSFVAGEPLTDSSTGAATVGTLSGGPVGTNAAIRNMVIAENTVDCRGSVRDTNHAQLAIHVNVSDPSPSTANLKFPGCRILNNSFAGGSGNAAVYYQAYFYYASNWQITGNVFDDVMDSNCTYAVALDHCSDLLFNNNTISNCGSKALVCTTNTNLQLVGNTFYQWAARGGQGHCVDLVSTNANVAARNNIFDIGGCKAPTYTISGDTTTTGFEYSGNMSYGLSITIEAAGAYVAETGTTQTHGFGSYSPADAGTSFTITNTTKVFASSQVIVTQTAATTQRFHKVLVANGSFTVTPNLSFLGASYSWVIIN